MKKLLLAVAVISVASLAGCGVPKTRGEYISDSYTKPQSFTVARKFDAVVASLNKQANTCVNKEYTARQVIGGHSSSYRVERIMTIAKTSANRAELTYRVKDSSMVGVPEGGEFMFAADLKAQGAGSTQVTFYVRYSSDVLTNAVREWMKGNDKSCGFGEQ